jgi:hypothetical protein
VSSKWTRHPKTATAVRGDRLQLGLSAKKWVATRGASAYVLDAAPDESRLEQAIYEADVTFPPDGWTFTDKVWSRPGWSVSSGDEGWNVYTVNGQPHNSRLASVRTFDTPDRARWWAELRLDRTGTNLRGPKPRAGKRSTSKLPDVRVTPSEREEATAITQALGMTYSEFARAALAFARDHIIEGAEYEVQDKDGAPRFVRT